MEHKIAVKGLLLLVLLSTSCSNLPPTNTPAARITGEQTVHCLLPARVRMLGNVVYPERRQLVFESQTRCTLRGGEFTVYDRASAQSSAEFYRVLAEAGDVEAQYSLALVYESLFSPPRYQDAAYWYQIAADNNHTNAMKNLSYLYEQGLGVEQDSLAAIRLLRQSGGIMDDLVLASEMDRAVSEAAAEVQRLTAVLETQNQQTVELQAALVQSNQEVLDRRGQLREAHDQLIQIRSDVEALSRQVAQSPDQEPNSAEIAQLEKLEQDLASKEQQVSEQELVIASLEADLEANRAQLDASELRAELQEQRLQVQLANAEQQAAESTELQLALTVQEAQITALNGALGDLRQRRSVEQQQNRSLMRELQSLNGELASTRNESGTLLESLLTTLATREETINQQYQHIEELERLQLVTNSTESEVQLLEDQLAELRDALQNHRLGYSELQAELENARAVDQAQETELERLLSEVASRGETIANQAAQIGQLETQTAQTRAAIAELMEARKASVDELDVVNARLVTTEHDLLTTRSELIKHQSELAEDELLQAELTRENETLKELLALSSSSSDVLVADLQEQLRINSEQLRTQNQMISDLQGEIGARQDDLAKFERERVGQLALRNVPRTTFPSMPPDFELPSGTKRALIIGNDLYQYDDIDDLSTAVTGASAVAEILRSKYGFQTKLLTNATRREILAAFAELQSMQKDDDYVLIYYAGHGARSSINESYWLPVEAQTNELSLEADGIKSDWITGQMRSMKAKHVMVIADSCYAGAMVRSTSFSVGEKDINSIRLRFMVNNRSRTVLSSGGNSPVLDKSVDGSHSVFTKALLEILENNSGIIYGEALHAALVQMVRFNAEQLDFTQVPLFSEIAAADHGNGQFVFSPDGG